MIKYVEHTGSGEVLSCGIAGVADVTLIPARLGAAIVAFDGECRPGWIYENGTASPLPPQPSPSHKFNYATKQWVPDTGLADAQAKAKRSQLLQQSDWTQLPDVPIATKEAWATYRQALRDITEQPGYPLQVVWPVAPA